MQNIVKEFNDLVKKYHTKPMPVSARMLDIQSEVGELSKEVLKSTKYGTKDFVVSEDFKMEFGDVMYALLSLACETEINAKECLLDAINKMKTRLETKSNLGSNN